jgi:enterochelin esterase-like enzyme
MFNEWQTPENFDRMNDGTEYGKLTEVEYYSNTTDTARKCFVYTPPCYNSETVYPVMYLLHGIGGTHTEWLNGVPNEILSNLIASGEAKPMIVVIPNVRASKDDSVPKEIFTPAHTAAFDNFINDLRNDLMPFINANYKVSNKREGRAVAGLSMGGRESLFIGVSMADTFGYIGAFSPAPGLLPSALANDRMNHPGMLSKEEMTLPDNYKKNTFILICNGNDELMFNDLAVSYTNAFKNNGIEPVYYTVDGGHDFRVWKNGLYHFAKRIFK